MTVAFPRKQPDLDGVACAIAYSQYLNETGTVALPWLPTPGDGEAEYALRECMPVTFAEQHSFNDETRFVLVDACDLEGFPEAVATEQVVLIIDHRFHGDPKKCFPAAAVHIEAVGAAATLVTEMFRNANLIPSQDNGRLLYGAIHSNTQRLRGGITTARDREAAAWLESVIAIPIDFLDKQFGARRADLLANVADSIARESKLYQHPEGPYVVAQLEFMGASEFRESEQSVLENALRQLGPRAMVNLVDVETGNSELIVLSDPMRQLVARTLNAKFEGSVARFRPGILRKQIVAAVQATSI